MFVALFADFLAHERPLYCVYQGKSYYPILHEYLEKTKIAKPYPAFLNQDWKTISYDKVVFPPIPYAPYTLDLSRAYKSPSQVAAQKHYLGTGELGKDVLAGLIHGTRIALVVGLIAMFIAAIIGITLGSLAGYFGDERFRLSWASLWGGCVGVLLASFYAFVVRSYALSEATANGQSWRAWGGSILLFVGIVLFFVFIAFFIKKIFPTTRKKVSIPIDILVMRLSEIFNAIPTLLFLLAAVAVLQQSSVLSVMLIIGLLRWTGIARFIRSEMLRIRNLHYIEAAQTMGFSDWRTLWRHALPNGLTSVLILIAFGIASAILLEASLSFLGIGVAPDDVTWGKLLAQARQKPSAWWLAVAPGAAIFVSVLLFSLIGEGLSDGLDPKRSK